MPKISIIIPTLGEKTLNAVLESIRTQNFSDYETVVVDSSGEAQVSELARKFDLNLIKTSSSVGLLHAKYLASQKATGDFLLFLDASKMLKPTALSTLSQMSDNYDMVLLFEERVGNSMWTNLSKLDREILLENPNRYRHGELADYLVPRFYRKSLADYSLQKIKSALPEDLFNKVLWPEDRLIFLEAKKLSRRIGVADFPLITHIGDDTFFSVVKKYRRYGKSYRMLRQYNAYSGQINVSRVRSMESTAWLDRMSLYALYSARLLSFAVGYYFG